MKSYFSKKKIKEGGGGETIKSEIGTNPLHAVKEGKGPPRQTSCRAPRQTPWSSSNSNQVGMILAVLDYP